MSEKLAIVRDQKGLPKDLILEEPAPVQEVQVAPEPEQIEAQPEVEVEVAPEPAPFKETRNAQNFRALKAETERIARERDEAQALIRQYELEKKSRQTAYQAPVPETDTDFDIDADAYAEGKHVKQLSKQYKQLKQELEQSRTETRNMATRAALIAEHPDYERVMSAENLKTLELTYPHIARSINMSDPYNAGKACYDLIKQFGIDAEETAKTEVTKAMIKQNLAKPKPGVAVQGTKSASQSPMGRASEFYEGPLTDEMKKIFYKELQDAIGK